MYNKYRTFFIILITLSQLVAQTSKETIAVLPIQCTGFNDENISDAITEFTQNAFVTYSDYKIIEKRLNAFFKQEFFSFLIITKWLPKPSLSKDCQYKNQQIFF